ncbi:MAG: TIM barrel protein [Pseudomonadota bacterium]
MPDGVTGFALNHVTLRALEWRALLRLAQDLNCAGIELRNDLAAPLFGGVPAETIATACEDHGLRLLALAEVPGFNDTDTDTKETVKRLADLARRSGAEAIALIPRVGGPPIAPERTAAALANLKPILDDAGIRGLVEPVGFAASTLRSKAQAWAAIEAADATDTYRLIHDTFHHALAGEATLYPAQTALVHISGVAQAACGPDMGDADRGLVDAQDGLGTVAQIAALRRAGYRGPTSFEAFDPALENLDDPASALAESMAFIATQLTAQAA